MMLLTGVKPSYYISQIESANPNKYFTLVVIGRIADALNIDIKELFDEENIDK